MRPFSTLRGRRTAQRGGIVTVALETPYGRRRDDTGQHRCYVEPVDAAAGNFGESNRGAIAVSATMVTHMMIRMIRPPTALLTFVLALSAYVAATLGAPPTPASGGRAAGDPLPLLPPDAVTIHVSTTTGVDGQDGLTPETAVKTIRRGQALLRDERGDRLLLKRGDTFDENFGSWNKSGNSPEAPLVIGAYGDGPRPKIVSQQTVFNIYRSPLIHDLTISGLHLTAAGRDPDAPDYDPAAPSNPAIRIVQPIHRLTIEDCRIEFFNGNLILTGDDRKGRLQDVTVRRCVILDAYATGGAHSGQGLYASKVDGLTIEDCLFDHNGWNEKIPDALPNIYRHNIYISNDSSGVRVRNNVISNGASHGIQMRSGGVCEGNLFVDNAIHAFLAGEEAVFRGNVVVGGRDIDAKTPRGFGVNVAAGRGTIEDNLLVHKPSTTGAAFVVEVGKWSPASGVNAEIRNNVVYHWSGNGLEVTAEAKSLSFHDNDLQRIAGKGRKVVSIKKPVGEVTLANNRYHAEDPRKDKWFSLPEGLVAPTEWGQKTRDTSRLEQARYRDADRTLPADFVADARAEKADVTAAAAIAPLREAFGMKPAPPRGNSPRDNRARGLNARREIPARGGATDNSPRGAAVGAPRAAPRPGPTPRP